MKEAWRSPLFATTASVLALGVAACGSGQSTNPNSRVKRYHGPNLPYHNIKSYPDGSIIYNVGDGNSNDTTVKLYCEGKDLITLLSGQGTNGDMLTRSVDDPRCPGKLAVSSILPPKTTG